MHALAPLDRWVQQRSTMPEDIPGFDHRVGGGPVPALDSDITLTLPARPENISLVRHMIGALGAAIRLPEATVDDMRLAVTEACTNVVRHAYSEDDGRIEVVIRPDGDAINVIVSDHGRGIGASPDVSGPGLGLSLIAALADRLEIDHAPQKGSRLLMAFLRRRSAHPVGAV
jgi:anti-sigma regulatory factor (Ser/Thr protein kinase)